MRTRSPIQPLRGDENVDGFSELCFDTLFATGLHLALFPHPLRPIISGVK